MTIALAFFFVVISFFSLPTDAISRTCWLPLSRWVWINLTMTQHISAYLLSSYFKGAVLPLKYSLPATFETFGIYPLLGVPKTVQRVEPRRSKLSTHPVPPRRASGSFRPCARVARNTDSADSSNLHLRYSRDFSNRFCNKNILTPIYLPELCTII